MLLLPLGILLAVNLIFALLAMTVILAIEVRALALMLIGAVNNFFFFRQPVAAGSGVPEVIAFLNGVKIPRIARIKTMLVKLFATILGVPAGLAIGPEGPIVQLGGIVGASLAQGKSTSFGVETGYNKVHGSLHSPPLTLGTGVSK